MRYDAIGDMIVTLPMIEEIHRLLPNATIDVVASPANKGLLSDIPFVRNVFVHNKTSKSILRLPAQTRGNRYDLVFSVVVNRTSHAGIVAGVIAGRNTIVAAFGHEQRKHLYNTWFNIQVPVERNKETMAEMQIQLVRTVLGDTSAEPKPLIKLQFSTEVEQQAVGLMTNMNGTIIGLNIGAGVAYRRWSVERNAELIQLLLAANPDTSVLIFSDSSRESDAFTLQTMFSSRVHVFPVQNDIRVVFAALKK